MWRKNFWLAAVVLSASGGLEAQAAPAPNPSLSALDSGVNEAEAVSHELEITDLDVRVEVVGNVAETTVTARFANSGGNDLEGTFTLQLPDGAVVSGYALDVEEVMIDGVLMPPVRARLAFEEKLRVRVDPGLGEVRRGNVFSTRVYPILAAGRIIRLKFAAPVSPGRGYELPLVSHTPIARATLGVRVRKGEASPDLGWPVAVKSEWRRVDGDLVNEIVLKNQKLDGAMSIGAAATDGRAFVTRHPSGRRFVELRDVAPGAAPAQSRPRSLRIYWDRSGSRREADLARELELLERYVAATGVTKLEVVPFSSSGATALKAQDVTLATRAIRALDYRGATSFDVLARGSSAAADVCLMFSDGVATIDARPELRFGCQLHAITSAADADLGYLGLLTRLNGGTTVSLARVTPEEAVRRLVTPAPRVLEARSDEGESLRVATLDAGARGWAVVVDAPARGDLVLRLSGVEPGIVERRYTLLNSYGSFAGTGALWAGSRVQELAGDAEQDAELRELSQRYSIASPAMSFIVFEAPEDYINARVAPPASYPAELLEEYREEKLDADEEAAERKAEWLEELVEAWQEQKEWWAEKYESATEPEDLPNVIATSPAPSAAAPAPAAAGSADIGRMPHRVAAQAIESSGAVDEIAVTGMRASDVGPKISLELEPWKPERPYLVALEAAGAGEYARELDAQQSRYGAMPAFYFDVAEWLYRRQRVAEAIEILLSALELPAQDTQTLALVADRLQRYGALDRAIWIHERVRYLEPHRPQPARNLARALQQRGLASRGTSARADLERAMALLTELIMTPPEEDYEGIELVALMDANEVIPRLRAAGSRKIELDPRLIAVLDVDLRVVIEWNTPGTDMDLWVDQPDGERCVYSNAETSIGGQLSNDMTSGYGPEQYLLRRAIGGEYAISIDVFATDAINPNGATMVTAHLTRNYGRRNQKTETMELELRPEDEGEKLVGKFRVGRGR
jgi:tetratricopeptide (TPR) repeat protein